MIKISHEVPLCLLEQSLQFNDYQYVLPHLIDLYPEYKQFILDYRKQEDSFIVADNGLFECQFHTTQDLIDKINLVKPNIFIVPDEWNDCNVGFKNAKYWMNTVKESLPENVELMVVLQGKSFSEIKSLYLSCRDMLGYKHFAFNHSSVAYQNEFNHPNVLVNQMNGRIEIISRLVKDGTILEHDYIHLLGCSLKEEFNYYKEHNFKNVKSLDTSNPILKGYEKVSYVVESNDMFKYTKPKTKIDDIMTKNLDTREKFIILDNIRHFKNIVK